MDNRVECQWPEGGKCQIAFVGEAPGADEIARGKPFVGRSGKLFNKMLRKVDIDRAKCLVTNVFDFELHGNSIKPLCVPQKEADNVENWPMLQVPVEHGAYVPANIAIPQLRRLYAEISEVDPNIVVALGGTAVWALLAIGPYGAMKKLRGTVDMGAGLCDLKVLVTYHPAYVTRNYSMAPIVTADFAKAKRESEYPEIRRPKIDIFIPRRPEEVEDFLNDIGQLAAVDIETLKGTIDNIGFADCFSSAMSVPIYHPDTGESYWATPEDEKRVLEAIAKYLADPLRHKVFQNGSYDVQWLYEKWGMITMGWTDDTRLLHHSLWPESPKDLGTIASLHLNMPSWKLAGAGRVSTKKED